jgi:hypothetical protein
MYENRTVKPVEIFLRRGRRGIKEKNSRDDPKIDCKHLYKCHKRKYSQENHLRWKKTVRHDQVESDPKKIMAGGKILNKKIKQK